MTHVPSFAVIMGLILWAQSSHVQDCPRSPVHTCEECVTSSPGCAWCKGKFFGLGETSFPRCDSSERLLKNGCEERDMLDPESLLSVIASSERKGRRAASLTPQNMTMELRPGKPLTFEVQVKRPKKSPVEVYYLTSLSFTTKDSLSKVTLLGGQVLSAVQEVNPEAHSIGFGLFGRQQSQDPEKSGCGEGGLGCERVFSFSHSSSLSDSLGPLAEALKNDSAPSEDVLLALQQTAVCGDLIGWGQGERLLVYVSDRGFRAAEGQASDAGRADDSGQCHLTEGRQHISNRADYPAVAELANRLTENSIQVIFAVTEEVAEKYEDLSGLLPKSTVAILPPDRSVKAVVKEAYDKLSSTLVVSHTHVPGLNVSYSSGCPGGERESSLRGACVVVEGSGQFSMNVTVSSESCLESQSFHLQLLGSPDRLSVHLKSLCGCECGDAPDPDFCSYSGNPHCGVCRCDAGYSGSTCECSVDQSDAPCRETEGSQVCSGRGDCLCGQCSCHTPSVPGRRVFGQFCQCDNFGCDYHGGKLCGGHGRCDCGHCACDLGFVGKACGCSTEVDQCRSPDGALCSNQGSCVCNQCQCAGYYAGPLCEDCPTCQGSCARLLSCVECLAFGSGRFRDDCPAKCVNVRHTTVDTLPANGICLMKDSQSCLMSYVVSRAEGSVVYEAQVKAQRDC